MERRVYLRTVISVSWHHKNPTKLVSLVQSRHHHHFIKMELVLTITSLNHEWPLTGNHYSMFWLAISCLLHCWRLYLWWLALPVVQYVIHSMIYSHPEIADILFTWLHYIIFSCSVNVYMYYSRCKKKSTFDVGMCRYITIICNGLLLTTDDTIWKK
jgi:hypothetical protein